MHIRPKLPRHLYTFKSLRVIPNVVIIFVHGESNLEIYTLRLLETLGNPTKLLDFCVFITLKSMFLKIGILFLKVKYSKTNLCQLNYLFSSLSNDILIVNRC